MKPGDKVYVKKVGNAARGCEPENLITEETIESVGRKYFYLIGYYRNKFSITEKRDISEYSSEFVVYESKKEIDDEEEYNYKLKSIRDKIGNYGKCDLDLDKIRVIHDLIYLCTINHGYQS